MKPTREEVLRLMRQASGGILTQVAEDPRCGYEIKVEELQTFAELLQAQPAQEPFCYAAPTVFHRMKSNDEVLCNLVKSREHCDENYRPLYTEPVHVAKPLVDGAVASNECGSVPFTFHELDLLRQWFNAVTDLNRAYLTPDDKALMLKIALLQSGMQPPNNQPNSDHVAVISAKPDSAHLDKPVETATNPRLTADHIIATALSYGHPVEELFVGFFKRELVTFVRRLEKDSAFAPSMLSALQDSAAAERSFNASKYMQVVYSPNSRQPYIDGWNAALLALQSGMSAPKTTGQPNEQNDVVQEGKQ